jgi:hypothetical protein
MKIFIVTVIFMLGVCACTGQHPMQEGWGETTKSYHEVSVINPNGQAVTVMALDGEKSNQVVDAYRAETGAMQNERIVKDVGSN